MSKTATFIAAVGIASLAVLMLISLPNPRQTSTIPFTLDDGTSGAVTLIVPETLRQGDWTEIVMDVTFNAAASSDQNVKVKTTLQTTDMQVNPEGEVAAVIPVKGIAPFRWRLRSSSAGEQRVTMWCFRQDADGQTLILARELEIEAKSFLGITFRLTRWILGAAAVLCALVFYCSMVKRKHKKTSA